MDKTTQGLKTLAEYMGEMPNLPAISDLWDKPRIYKPYNTSWDALVPVYAKAYAEIRSKNSSVFNVLLKQSQLSQDYYLAHDTDNKQSAFEAVVELVNLINKENNETFNKEKA